MNVESGEDESLIFERIVQQNDEEAHGNVFSSTGRESEIHVKQIHERQAGEDTDGKREKQELKVRSDEVEATRSSLVDTVKTSEPRDIY